MNLKRLVKKKMANRTIKQKAALRKAQLASARKRKGRGKRGGPAVKRSAGRAFVAGLALGGSNKLNKRAGFTGAEHARITKKGQYDKRHRIKSKNKYARFGAYAAGVGTTAVALGVATGGLHAYNHHRVMKKYNKQAFATNSRGVTTRR